MLLRRSVMICTAATLGLAFGSVAAHAGTPLSASAMGSGPDWTTATRQAEANANGDLFELARSRGETCTDVTFTASLSFIIPGGGGYVFTATATGDCG